MFSSEMEDYLKHPRFMVLGTHRENGTIQMSVVWYELNDGVFLVSTTKQRAKYKNVMKDPRVTFVIYNDKNPYQYIQVEGKVSASTEGAHEFIDHLSEIYTGKTPYASDPEHKEDRVVLTITPDRFTTFGFQKA